jgi:hypothetical protein
VLHSLAFDGFRIWLVATASAVEGGREFCGGGKRAGERSEKWKGFDEGIFGVGLSWDVSLFLPASF